jgi:hypothetical protein
LPTAVEPARRIVKGAFKVQVPNEAGPQTVERRYDQVASPGPLASLR